MMCFPFLSGANNNHNSFKNRTGSVYAMEQIDTTKNVPQKTYLITTAEGNEFSGTIISQDEREVVIDTKNKGRIAIPKYQIKVMKEISSKELTQEGDYNPEPEFASRYFITTNGLPLKKGDNYILWNIYGPDIQFSLSDHFGVGIMTSWVGIPVIGTAKYSFNLGKNTNMAIGGLFGTGSWSAPEFGLALPFAAFTYGDRKNNINFSGGYGSIWTDTDSEGKALFSIAGITALGKKASLVFDSFIIPGSANSDGYSLIVPGFRIQTNRGRFFQFGFAAIYNNGEVVAALPMFQWFTRF